MDNYVRNWLAFCASGKGLKWYTVVLPGVLGGIRGCVIPAGFLVLKVYLVYIMVKVGSGILVELVDNGDGFV